MVHRSWWTGKAVHNVHEVARHMRDLRWWGTWWGTRYMMGHEVHDGTRGKWGTRAPGREGYWSKDGRKSTWKGGLSLAGCTMSGTRLAYSMHVPSEVIRIMPAIRNRSSNSFGAGSTTWRPLKWKDTSLSQMGSQIRDDEPNQSDWWANGQWGPRPGSERCEACGIGCDMRCELEDSK